MSLNASSNYLYVYLRQNIVFFLNIFEEFEMSYLEVLTSVMICFDSKHLNIRKSDIVKNIGQISNFFKCLTL